MTLYLKDALWLDPADFSITSTHLAADRGPYGQSRPVASIPPGAATLDCKGRLVTRSFACGHHHAYSSLARGMPAPPKAPANFPEILEYVWWRLDKRLDADMTEASALACAVACAKSGVTFVVDHHSSPGAVRGSLERVARAFERVGIGHLLCYETSCRDGLEAAMAGLEETDAYLCSGRKGHVGLHASFTVDEHVLAEAVTLASRHETGVHIHAAEDSADQEHCLRAHGKRVAQRLADAGVLDLPGSILAHCVHMTPEERELIRSSRAWVAQNTESNLNNAVGLTSYRDFGPRVILGTDGMHSDMLASARAAFLAGQAREGLSPLEAYRRLRAVHALIAASGAPGDGGNNLVVLDYDSPTDVTQANFPAHFAYGLGARHVSAVVAQGRVIVEEGRLVSADEGEILAFTRAQARRLWARLAEGA